MPVFLLSLLIRAMPAGEEAVGRVETRDRPGPLTQLASMQMNASSVKIAPAVTFYYRQVIGLRLLETGKSRRSRLRFAEEA